MMDMDDAVVDQVGLPKQPDRSDAESPIDIDFLMPSLPKSYPEPEPIGSESKLFSGMPSLADMPLHEWVAALTHPSNGQYPNGITTRMMDSLVRQMGVNQFPGPDRRRYHNVWKTISHFAVFLSEAARKGRIRRVSLGTYKGVFGDKQASLQAFQTPLVPSMSSIPSSKFTLLTKRASSKRKSFFPRRHPGPSINPKRVCITGPSPPTTGPEDFELQNGVSKSGNERPPSCDSMNGGSGSSSTDDCPVGTMIIRKRGPTLEVIRKSDTFVPVAEVPQRARMSGDIIPIMAAKESRLCRRQTGPKRCQNSDMDEFGLPCLLKLEPSLTTIGSMESLGSLSSTEVAVMCEKLGNEEGARALLREEVDGTALLLLSRQDITHNLGLRLGPALKLHRLVHALQSCAKNSQQATCAIGRI